MKPRKNTKLWRDGLTTTQKKEAEKKLREWLRRCKANEKM